MIGAGGMGAPLLLYLAAGGVGTLGIVDDDKVALSKTVESAAHFFLMFLAACRGMPSALAFSAALASSHSASISASVDSLGVLPRALSARSIDAKRRSNF